MDIREISNAKVQSSKFKGMSKSKAENPQIFKEESLDIESFVIDLIFGF
jgi:hypothetical protein